MQRPAGIGPSNPSRHVVAPDGVGYASGDAPTPDDSVQWRHLGLQQPANMVLLTASLTPDVGDKVYSLGRVPGATGDDRQSPVEVRDGFTIEVPEGWVTGGEWTWSGTYTSQQSQNCLLFVGTAPEGEDTLYTVPAKRQDGEPAWPNRYAAVDPADGHFVPIDLPALSVVAVGCGMADMEQRDTIFVGHNEEDWYGQSTALSPATSFMTPATLAEDVILPELIGALGGNLNGMQRLSQVLAWLNTLAVSGMNTPDLIATARSEDTLTVRKTDGTTATVNGASLSAGLYVLIEGTSPASYAVTTGSGLADADLPGDGVYGAKGAEQNGANGVVSFVINGLAYPMPNFTLPPMLAGRHMPMVIQTDDVAAPDDLENPDQDWLDAAAAAAATWSSMVDYMLTNIHAADGIGAGDYVYVADGVYGSTNAVVLQTHGPGVVCTMAADSLQPTIGVNWDSALFINLSLGFVPVGDARLWYVTQQGGIGRPRHVVLTGRYVLPVDNAVTADHKSIVLIDADEDGPVAVHLGPAENAASESTSTVTIIRVDNNAGIACQCDGAPVGGVSNMPIPPNTVTVLVRNWATNSTHFDLIYQGPAYVIPSDLDPLPDGTADPGTSPELSRADHVHPSDGGAPTLFVTAIGPVDLDDEYGSVRPVKLSGTPTDVVLGFSGMGIGATVLDPAVPSLTTILDEDTVTSAPTETVDDASTLETITGLTLDAPWSAASGQTTLDVPFSTSGPAVLGARVDVEDRNDGDIIDTVVMVYKATGANTDAYLAVVGASDELLVGSSDQPLTGHEAHTVGTFHGPVTDFGDQTIIVQIDPPQAINVPGSLRAQWIVTNPDEAIDFEVQSITFSGPTRPTIETVTPPPGVYVSTLAPSAIGGIQWVLYPDGVHHQWLNDPGPAAVRWVAGNIDHTPGDRFFAVGTPDGNAVYDLGAASADVGCIIELHHQSGFGTFDFTIVGAVDGDVNVPLWHTARVYSDGGSWIVLGITDARSLAPRLVNDINDELVTTDGEVFVLANGARTFDISAAARYLTYRVKVDAASSGDVTLTGEDIDGAPGPSIGPAGWFSFRRGADDLIYQVG